MNSFKKILGMCLCLLPWVAFSAWPTYHGNYDLSGFSETKLPARPALNWRYASGGEVYSAPVSNGELIFVSVGKGRLLALNLAGDMVWEKTLIRKSAAGQDLPMKFEAPLTCSSNLVFAGSTSGVLFALHAENGKQKWKYETGGILVGAPNMLNENTVVVLDQGEGALHAIDLKSGKAVWKTDGVERCDGSPGIGKHHIVFGSCLAALHVYSHDGTHLKDIEIGDEGQIAGGVAVVGGHAFAGLRDGAVVCVDLEAGELLWSHQESEEQTFTTPAVSKNVVVYGSDNGWVYAVKRTNGESLWSFDTQGIPSSPVIAGSQILVSADGVLFGLELSDGSKTWALEISDEISSPALVKGQVVVGADDGTVGMWGEDR